MRLQDAPYPGPPGAWRDDRTALLSWRLHCRCRHPVTQAGGDKRLPVIGPAPPFTLTSQDGKPVALADLRGKVVARDLHLYRLPGHLPDADAEDGRRAGRAGGGVRRQDRLRFDHPRSGARHAGGAEGLCPILGRQARRVELS